MIVGFGVTVLGFVIYAYWETRPQKAELSDRDPRVVLSYEYGTGALGADGHFILRNRGGVDAHDVQIKNLRFKKFSLCFPCVPILGTQGGEVRVDAEIFDLNSEQLGQQRVITTNAALEEDWMDFNTSEILGSKGKVSYEGQIAYDDYRGSKFLTEFTLTYTLASQTAQIRK
jgi:hypothetical protein